MLILILNLFNMRSFHQPRISVLIDSWKNNLNIISLGLVAQGEDLVYVANFKIILKKCNHWGYLRAPRVGKQWSGARWSKTPFVCEEGPKHMGRIETPLLLLLFFNLKF